MKSFRVGVREVLCIELQEQHLLFQYCYNPVADLAIPFYPRPTAVRELLPAVTETHKFAEFLWGNLVHVVGTRRATLMWTFPTPFTLSGRVTLVDFRDPHTLGARILHLLAVRLPPVLEVLCVELLEYHLLLQDYTNAMATGTPERDTRMPTAARELAPALAETHMFIEFLHGDVVHWVVVGSSSAYVMEVYFFWLSHTISRKFQIEIQFQFRFQPQIFSTDSPNTAK